MNNALTFIGTLLIFASSIPYIVDIVRRKTRPNVVSWFTWLLLISIGGFATLAAHQTRTAILTFADAAQVATILLLGLKYGYAKVTKGDIACQIGALVGLGLWQVFDNPVVAIVATIVVDFIAAIPTYRHSWQSPSEETWQTFLISSVGALFGIASLASFSLSSLAYPLYVFLLGLTLSGTIIVGRRAKGIRLLR